MWSVIIRQYRSEAKQTSARMPPETAEENFFRSLLWITEKPSIKKEQGARYLAERGSLYYSLVLLFP